MTGEDVEVYLSRGTGTEIRVYEGEVESLSSATSAGAGIRVVSGGRQGFAFAGSLEEDVLKPRPWTKRAAMPEFSTAETWVGLPAPDGTNPAGLDLWREELAACPTKSKVDAALDLERAVLGGRPPDKEGRDRQLG